MKDRSDRSTIAHPAHITVSPARVALCRESLSIAIRANGAILPQNLFQSSNTGILTSKGPEHISKCFMASQLDLSLCELNVSVRATPSFQPAHAFDAVGVWTNNDND
jgi:hypothetical protein